MFSFWRYTIAFLAVTASSIIFFFLVKTSVYDIQFSDSLPSKGVQDIPPADTILPNIFAKIPPPSPASPAPTSSLPTSSLPTSSLPTSSPTLPTRAKQINNPKQTSSSQSSLNFQGAVSPQQCFDYAKNCRDVQCAFQKFNVICDNTGIGPTCTCGMGQASGASSIQSIQSNAHFVFLLTFITFIFYQFC